MNPSDPVPSPVRPPALSGPDIELVNALRRGDTAAFGRIVDEWSPTMLRVARYYVRSDASAEDVVQEAWVAALKGLQGFEGRSSLRTWALRIVANIARTLAIKEGRSSSLADPGPGGPAVARQRFQGPGEPHPGSWREAPAPWPSLPESQVLASEAYEVVREAVGTLPEAQRTVITLRDLDGLSSEEVCDVLGITAGHQRVLLHRARATVRTRVEPYFAARSRS
ncbi:MAG TPA: sigma-70 family RNA polymerase sigma factor [Acidimicrobiales bacterium]|nr:sigma-70 family RNA polymerase sigma factor [Acidimicrobiales bacterium]